MTTGHTQSEDAQRFLAQNPDYAKTLTGDDLATVELYADDHAGGLVALIRQLEDDRYVKSHESWGGEEDGKLHVVHHYNPDWDGAPDGDPKETTAFYATGHEAIAAFLTDGPGRPVGFEAVCAACGETFNPDGEDDLIHAQRADGTECGGSGTVTGSWR